MQNTRDRKVESWDQASLEENLGGAWMLLLPMMTTPANKADSNPALVEPIFEWGRVKGEGKKQ